MVAVDSYHTLFSLSLVRIIIIAMEKKLVRSTLFSLFHSLHCSRPVCSVFLVLSLSFHVKKSTGCFVPSCKCKWNICQ